MTDTTKSPDAGARRDYMVTVCDECRCASCWHGEFQCEKARRAGTERIPASVLSQQRFEHPDNFTEAKLLRVCGSIEYLEQPLLAPK